MYSCYRRTRRYLERHGRPGRPSSAAANARACAPAAQIVRAATELVLEDGYERATIARIAERADLATRTVTTRFPSKEDDLLRGRRRTPSTAPSGTSPTATATSSTGCARGSTRCPARAEREPEDPEIRAPAQPRRSPRDPDLRALLRPALRPRARAIADAVAADTGQLAGRRRPADDRRRRDRDAARRRAPRRRAVRRGARRARARLRRPARRAGRAQQVTDRYGAWSLNQRGTLPRPRVPGGHARERAGCDNLRVAHRLSRLRGRTYAGGMSSTRFTELLGCRVPIQQAPMGCVSSDPPLPVAVAAAGAIGMLSGVLQPAGPARRRRSTRCRPGRSA